ncbi:hypothetical protein FRC12_006396 [Ceratobasidium sp. 428]|nr:hypothetical protein FRC12_006396 [Ceratobasidium sp. 428]
MAPRKDTVSTPTAHRGGPVNNFHTSRAYQFFGTLILMAEHAYAMVAVGVPTQNEHRQESAPRRRPAAVVAVDAPVRGQIKAPAVIRPCRLSFIARWLLFLIVMILLSFSTSIIRVLTWQILEYSPQVTTVEGVAMAAGNVLAANPGRAIHSRMIFQ